MSNQKLKKVKPYKTANLSRVLRLVFFTWSFTILGLLIAYQNQNLIKSPHILFPLSGGIGVIIGFYVGNIFTQFYENNKPPFLKLFFLPLYPYLILFLCSNIIKETNGFGLKNYLLIYSIGWIIVLPLIMYFDFKNLQYCENCKKSFKPIVIFAYRKVSPYQVLSLLNNKQIFPSTAELENDYSFPRYHQKKSRVSVAVYYCPRCYDAIVGGLLTYNVGSVGKEQREILFYSDIWQNGLFKEVFKKYFNYED